MQSTRTAYKPTARLLHWIVAILVIAMLPVGSIMITQGLDRSLANTLFILHKNTGVIILILMILRLAYRAVNRPGPLPASVPGWQRRIAGATHAALYFMAFFMAITGYVRVTMGGFPIEGLGAIGLHPLLPRNDAIAEIAKTAHFYGRYVFAAVIVLHIGAALHHAIILRDGVFRRIWPIWGR